MYFLYRLKPLFPGQNEIDQIDKIHKLFGTPPSEVLSKFKRSRSMSFNFPPSVRDERTLTHLVEPMPSDGVDLLYKMLEYDPAKRITMEECLQHLYLKNLRLGKKRLFDWILKYHFRDLRAMTSRAILLIPRLFWMFTDGNK